MKAEWKSKLMPVELGSVRKLSDHLIFTIFGISRYHVTGDYMHHSCLGIVLYLLGFKLEDAQHPTASSKSRRTLRTELSQRESLTNVESATKVLTTVEYIH